MSTKLVLSLVLLLSLPGCAIGLMRHAESIEATLLRETPLGTSRDDVLRSIAKRGYKDVRVNTRTGFYRDDLSKPQTVGSSSILALLGEYRMLFITSVEARWGFDSNDKLIAVWVRKPVDAL